MRKGQWNPFTLLCGQRHQPPQYNVGDRISSHRYEQLLQLKKKRKPGARRFLASTRFITKERGRVVCFNGKNSPIEAPPPPRASTALGSVVMERVIDKFCSNCVTTSRYTCANFVAKNLWEQFHRASNIYFLFIAFLQTFPHVTTTNGVPLIALPLCIVLLANGVKDAVEDYRRHKSDEMENRQIAYRINFTFKQNGEAGLSDSVPGTHDLKTSVSPGWPHVQERRRSLDDTLPLNNQQGSAKEGGATATGCTGTYTMEHALEDELETLGAFDLEDNDYEEEEYHEQLSLDPYIENGTLESVYWQDIKVGDILVLRNWDRFPADIVILASSDPQGIGLVDTASLDGESNLKIRQAHSKTTCLLGNNLPQALKLTARYKGALRCPAPNANLSSFNGVMDIESTFSFPTTDETLILRTLSPSMLPLSQPFSIGHGQLLLRGCQLRNTAWALGMVVYTGSDTKIQQNASEPSHKVSQVEKYTNIVTWIVFSFQIALSAIGAGITAYFVSDSGGGFHDLTYLGTTVQNVHPFVEAITRFFTWIVLFANMIPISLIVTVGIVKAAQAYFMAVDKDMYYSVNKMYAAPRTSDLNEELGQVKYLFTDKTGTLTCNSMEFRKCCVRGVGYGEGMTEIRRMVLRKTNCPENEQSYEASPPRKNAHERKTPQVNFVDSRLRSLLAASCVEEPQFHDTLEFFVHLAVNHSVVAENLDDPSSELPLSYSATSPDEGALVYGASHFDVRFKGRVSPGIMLLDVLGIPIKIQVLASVDFSSARKRSSIICKLPAVAALGWTKSRYVLYCKGSDTVILPRLMKADNLGVVSALQSELHTYSVDGLRTLCLAKRELDDASLSAWYKRYKEATLSLENREDKIEALAEELEEQFEWQGITGVEDKLQDGVSQTLKDFSAAGINAWMLTGDKMETAINIGIATSLLQPNTLQITYNAEEIMRHHEQNPESHIGDNLETETGQHRCLENECNRDLERQGEDCVESQPDFSLSESNGLPHDKGSLQGDLRRVTSSSDVPHSVTANLKTQKVFKNEISNDIQWQGTNSLSDVKDYTPYERHKGRTPSSILEMIVKERMTNDFAFLRKKQDVIISQQKRIQKQSFHKRHHSFSINEKIYESSESELLPVAVVIDGTCLAEALKPSISQIFFNLCSFCSTVICCRATPLQKAAVVSLVKKSQSGVTLAVGDGANDCNMIQQAHVGVGIRGAEGLQAFHVSDYGISQFKFLRILLLCHGRWNYWRISHLVLYMFYKNLVVVIPIFLAGFLSQFSAQKIYYELAYQLFNVFLTSVPVIIVGIFDQDLDKDTSLKFPQLYRLGHGHYFFNRRRFFQWLLQSVVHAAICFTIPVLVFSNAHITSSNGNSMGLFFIGQTIFGCVMIVINLKVILEVPLLTRLIWFAVIFSIFAWVLTMILFSSWPGLAPDLLGMLYDMLTTPLFYFTVVITCTMALSTDFVLKVIKRNFFPEVRDIVVEQPRFISVSKKQHQKMEFILKPHHSSL